jgi:hypothetical protein
MDKPKRGRPTAYTPECCERAYGYALLGKTLPQMADLFGVSLASLNRWIASKPVFRDAIKKGAEVADVAVANSLYSRATNGDTTACIFWLKNRQRAIWRDKHEIEQSGVIEHNHQVNLESLTTEEVKALQALLSKAQPKESDKESGKK